MPQCKAKSKRSGKRCKKDAMRGSDVCHIHGGKSLKGEQLPQFKHGKFSKYMPQRLKQRFEEVGSDKHVSVLGRNISIRDALLADRLQSLDDYPESSELWNKMQKLLSELTKAFENENYGGVKVCIDLMNEVVSDGMLMHMTIGDINDLMKEQRQDEKAIADIQYKGENAIPASQLMTLMGAVLHVITEVVTDKEQRIKIANGIDSIISVNSAVSSN